MELLSTTQKPQEKAHLTASPVHKVLFGIMEAFSYIKWPGSLSVIGEYSDIIQMNILQIAPLHCIFPDLEFDAFTSLFAVMGLNIAAVIVALASLALATWISTRHMSNEEEKMKKKEGIKAIVKRNLFFFLFVTYLNTCLKTAQVLPLACHRLCVDPKKDESCEEYSKADYSINCKGERYNRLVIVGYCSIVYVIALPAAAFTAIWKRKRAEKKNESSDTNGSEDQSTVQTGLRFLHENYSPRCWYWELVETFRKVILTCGLILLGGESRAYIGLALVFSGLYGIYFGWKSPIKDPFENKLMLSSLAVTFVNLAIGAVSSIPSERFESSVDPILDNLLFNGLVFVANSLVIGLLVVQYLAYIYHFVKEWRKNPKCSLSCCLALLLPLNQLQGEIRGLTETNILKQQLQTGKIEMPTIGSTLRESGAVVVTLEDHAEREQEEATTDEKTVERGLSTIAEVIFARTLGESGAVVVTLEDPAEREQEEATTDEKTVERGLSTIAEVIFASTLGESGAVVVTLEDPAEREQEEATTDEKTVERGLSTIAEVMFPSTLRESGAVNIALEDFTEREQEEATTDEKTIEQGVQTIVKVVIHEPPRETYDTKL
ncbi:uncharacterized protein [Porites lutea]|uniref:uncharacterized protein n=1 Tax=Porites lutea TaxID=51062 RepID=UPI003CC5C47A